uniref:RNA-dependent RNA polymerase n=1 Tax=Renton virus TaxID=1888322 RepID=A0A1B2RVQ6_9VIRU|nr:RNA-dependent RNA polymerase [Renton virus]
MASGEFYPTFAICLKESSDVQPLKFAGTIKSVAPYACQKRNISFNLLTHGLGYSVNLHNNCQCNEAISLCNRHGVVPDVKFDNHLWRNITRETEQFYTEHLEPSSYSELVSRYSGNKRRRYEKAQINLLCNAYENRYNYVEAFIKLDKMPTNKIKTKPPRMIQCRAAEYNLSFSRFIHPFEKTYYPKLIYGDVSGTRIVAKGLNPQERAELLLHKSKHFKRPRFFSGDHKTFDAYVNKYHLKSTHRKYKKHFNSKALHKCCKTQLLNKGLTRNGIRYNIDGTRMSGDPDTGLGNTLVNSDAIYGVLRQRGITKYSILLDGDDFVVILEDGEEITGSDFIPFGFKTEIEDSLLLSAVEFCQSRIVMTPERLTFVRNPERMLSNSRVCRKVYRPDEYVHWLASVGMCENSLYGDMPIYSAYAQSLLKFGYPSLIDRDMQRRMEGTMMDDRNKIVHPSTRVSFYEAWGVPPSVQIEVEQYLTSACMLDLDCFGHNDKPLQAAETTRRLLAKCSSSRWWYGG